MAALTAIPALLCTFSVLLTIGLQLFLACLPRLQVNMDCHPAVEVTKGRRIDWWHFTCSLIKERTAEACLLDEVFTIKESKGM